VLGQENKERKSWVFMRETSVGVRKRKLCMCVRECSEKLHVKLLCAAAQQQAMRENERPSVGERRKFCNEEKRRSRASVGERGSYFGV
jgi:hypothetical protein